MAGLDEGIARLGETSLAVALAVAALLGLRHATDPDHLSAVATLVAGDPQGGPRRARRLGLAWGAGHAVTLFACGLPLVLAGTALPEGAAQAAEAAVGLLIIALAVRLLRRWQRGAFHARTPPRDGVRDPHRPLQAAGGHDDRDSGPGRSSHAAFGIGLMHGVGGSAGAGVLLLGAVAPGLEGAMALALFATGTAASMALISTGVALGLGHAALAGRAERLVPVLGACSLLFGIAYALGALGPPVS